MLAVFLFPFTLVTVESITVGMWRANKGASLGLDEPEEILPAERLMIDEPEEIPAQVECVDNFSKQEMKKNIARSYLLHKHSAKIRLQMIDGNSDLHTAVETGCLKAVKLLLENGADRTAKNSAGDKPLDVAMKLENVGEKIDIIELLTRYDDKDALVDDDHETLPHEALLHETFTLEAAQRQSPAGMSAAF